MASSHTHTMGQVPAALRLLAAVACAAGAAAAWGGGQAPSPEARPDPVRWPGVFSSQTLTNRSNHFSLDKLWYDWNFKTGVGRQVIRIVGEDGSLVYDIMPGDGNAYYYNVNDNTCKSIKFGVSILTPEWQTGGQYLGQGEVDGIPCYKWRKGFGIQCTSTATKLPVTVTFDHHYDRLDPMRDRPTWDMRFMTWDPEDEAPEEIYNLAKLCPPAEPLPDTVMADIRRQLTADPYHTPHILLDSHKDDTKKSSNDIEIAAPAKEPYRSIVVPQGHPAADSVMRFARCPYLKAAEEAAGTNASPTKATA